MTTARRLTARIAHFGLDRPISLNDLPFSATPERIDAKKILLTGASSGVGEAAALALAAQGAELILVARGAEELTRVRDTIVARGGAATAHTADLADEGEVERLVATVLESHGTPDVLINNAGRSIRRSAIDSVDRLHDYRRTMAVNYFGPVGLMLGFLPGMKLRGSGHIVNVSTWGVPAGTMPKFSAYAGSKAALSIVGRSIGLELGAAGIAVSTIYFPLIRTPMIAPTAEYNTLPALTAEQAARWITHAVHHRPDELMPRYARILQRVAAIRAAGAGVVLGRLPT
ncbi:MAG: short-chain dehydrogenase [Gordonia sp.]|uniref:SDR family NAD(P)-dependent oxidoreductase n=1 Tax=Gordonia rubripertincta TaxID=36822 RepID=A0ABT4MN75_GORRU|nr:SDR family NAD(P)-dependent oxidoreductase [Gordonia rubripertincta]MBA4024225.1 short-chain dehydrogenase [Gordonia sp. (in: high G+C Gram-positive bacteria)]MCZ4548450.1 SDR family NAD(P)-dependent oxidoreductase [Gordonia rubripertincta]